MMYLIARTKCANGNVVETCRLQAWEMREGGNALVEWWETTVEREERTRSTDLDTARMAHFEAVRWSETLRR